ncbi:MAG: hypothetical protein FJ025_04015 [Chloroflexi bacterium]|nr:hypothetical protein [Chloroflexota bacterium]
MSPTELNDWLNWGAPLKTDKIGEWGQGGKAAMGYLGSAWIVHTKRWDQPWLWEIRENNWDDVSSDEKAYKAVPIKSDAQREGLGYCKFEIKNLKKHRQDINRLKAVLSNIYRKYLEEGKSSVTVNGEPVPPLELPIYEGFEIQQFKEKTSEGWWINGWIGRLKRDVRVRSTPRIAGGMRLLRRGRLICDSEYFGHHDFRYKASLGMLIGEVELTTKVPVLPNKTGFDTDSPEWDESQKVMYDILKPHIEALLKQEEEKTVTREEKKRVSQVRNLMIEAFKLLSKYGALSGRFGEDRGRKRPERKQQDLKEEDERIVYQEHQPRTPPSEDAVGRLRRLSKMPEWEPRVLGPEIRSEWGEKNGNRCLLINTAYCLYSERKGDDLYIAETAALQLARPEEDEKLTLEEYFNDVDLIMRAFCEVYNSTI